MKVGTCEASLVERFCKYDSGPEAVVYNTSLYPGKTDHYQIPEIGKHRF